MQIKVNKYIASGLLSALALSSLYGATATLPNTFVAHTPARASQVNENFLSLKSAIDNNDATKQKRVTGTCSAGESIRQINENGTVTCEVVDNKGSAGIEYAYKTSAVAVGNDAAIVLSATMTAPENGYVIATYTAWLAMGHAVGNSDKVEISLMSSDTPTNISSAQPAYKKLSLNKDMASGLDYGYPVTTQYFMQVSAGSKTFKAVAQKSDKVLAGLNNSVLVLQFFPNKY